MGTTMWYLQRATSVFILLYIMYIFYGYLIYPYSENGSLWFNDIRSILIATNPSIPSIKLIKLTNVNPTKKTVNGIKPLKN